MPKKSPTKESPTKHRMPEDYYVPPGKIKLTGRKVDYSDPTSTDSHVLTLGVADELRAFLPPIPKESKEWKLVYSIDQHGSSLATLVRTFFVFRTKDICHHLLIYSSRHIILAYCASISNADSPPSMLPCILAIRDTNDTTFGAFLSEAPQWRRGYYGNGQCFLWKKNSKGALVAYLSTGVNEHYILSEPGANLALGGGENGFALWIDGDLVQASSNKSSTFGNDPLSTATNFQILALELWTLQP